MSKARQLARADRQRAAAERDTARRVAAERATSARSRREQRALAWRRVRLWQHGPGFRRSRETWGALATLVLVALVAVFVFTRSWSTVLGTALVFVVAGPVLVMLFFDRSNK